MIAGNFRLIKSSCHTTRFFKRNFILTQYFLKIGFLLISGNFWLIKSVCHAIRFLIRNFILTQYFFLKKWLFFGKTDIFRKKAYWLLNELFGQYYFCIKNNNLTKIIILILPKNLAHNESLLRWAYFRNNSIKLVNVPNFTC